ncbi:MAG TPA: hypothetical protein DCE78_13235 [Bacteroidetes bacterium]|nr:hypothetical protein [Bacteroidota bacterium]
MDESKSLVVEYTSKSLNNALEISSYLRNRFSQKEVDTFYQALSEFEKIINHYPKLYKESKRLKIRRAVLSKVLSVYYRITKNKIVIIAILDNRWDESNKIQK